MAQQAWRGLMDMRQAGHGLNGLDVALTACLRRIFSGQRVHVPGTYLSVAMAAAGAIAWLV
eukprot:scaffold87164_cov20-Tisochrysis_lutea.AAC.1